MIYVLSHKIQNHAQYKSTHTVTIPQRHTGKPTHSGAKTIRLPQG